MPQEWEAEEDVVSALARRQEIALIVEFLQSINARAVDEFGNRVRVLSVEQLREIETDFVDILLAMEAAGRENGFVNFDTFPQEIQDAFARLAGVLNQSGWGYDTAQVMLQLEASALRHGHAAVNWPWVNEELLFGLLLDRAVPNSTRYNLTVSAGVLTLLSARVWVPAMGRAIVATPAMWDRFKVWLQAGGGNKAQSLSNEHARQWYRNELARIQSRIDTTKPLAQQARQAHELRNQARTQARNLMSDARLAEHLNRTQPNLTWEQIVQKYSAQGLSGDNLYRAIIDAATRSNPIVNEILNLLP